VTLDNYVVDVLMRDLIAHERSPSSFVVYVHLWRHTLGANRTNVHQSQPPTDRRRHGAVEELGPGSDSPAAPASPHRSAARDAHRTTGVRRLAPVVVKQRRAGLRAW
jgi:hypothetical protein